MAPSVKKLVFSLVLSGAGTLAGLHVGAVSALLAQSTEFSSLIGTSAGSIVAACIATGMPPAEMHRVVTTADYHSLIPIDWLEAPLRGYAASTRNVIAWLQELTDNKVMADCVIPLTCVTSDMWTGRVTTFSTEKTPDMPIWQAVLASMSIPDVFPMFDNRYVDGGVMCNLGVPFLPATGRRLGLRVVEANRTGPVANRFDEQERLIEMMLGASETELVMLAKAYDIPIIDLPGGNLGFLNRGMTSGQKEDLYEKGYATAQAWLDSEEGKRWAA